MAAPIHSEHQPRNGVNSGSHGYRGAPTSADNQDLELIRQRAIRAAEFYNHAISGAGQAMDKNASFHSDPSVDPYREPSTPNNHSGDAYYPHNLRAGFIDLRNSYNEKRKTKFTAYPSRPEYENRPGEKSREVRREPIRDHSRDRKLFRSNSSLELEALEVADSARVHRDYGSTSSLDVIGDSTNHANDSFFEMLQDYRSENPDQRAPPPPQIRDVLRGTMSRSGSTYTPTASSSLGAYHTPVTHKLSNGSSPQEEAPDLGSHSPRLKQKSIKIKDRKQRSKTMVADSTSNSASGGGLFRRKRIHKSESDSMVKSPENSSDGDIRNEDRQRRKLLIHYDCQSVSICFSEMIQRRQADAENEAIRRNQSTGASAASVRTAGLLDTQESDQSEPDHGDLMTNDLVLSCPYFRNEIGGEEERFVTLNIITAQNQVQQLFTTRLEKQTDRRTLMPPPACNGISILDMSEGPHGYKPQALLTHAGHVFEYVDQGAYHYRHFFSGTDHQNYFGIEDSLGPIAISLKREKVDESDREMWTRKQENAGYCHQYRIIVRTSELQTLRASILEEAFPSSSRLSSTRGLPHKEVLEFLLPELNVSCMKLATPGPKTTEQLIKLDEQGIYTSYKFGVMLCKSGQSSEEDMYNNHHGSPAFQEFLGIIGSEVRLRGFEKYKGGLDSKTDSTGTHSLYKEFHGFEIMFHVSTMLPFTPTNKQQLLRKRHIGNDIVTIIFQEPGSKPFTPKSVRSQFQHVFIIVRAHNPNTPNVKYSLSVSRAKDVPPFGPPIPDSVFFNKCQEFTEFLLTKAINAENAVHRSKKFTTMATRTRHEYLKDLALNYTSNTSLDSGSKLSKFSLGSGRRKEKLKLRTFPDIFAKGAVVWNVLLEDFGSLMQTDSFLGVAEESIIIVDTVTRAVLFTIPCKAVIGWTPQGNSLRIFYHRGECLLLHTYNSDCDEVSEMIDRLQSVTHGCETVEKTIQKDSKGQLGFHVYFEGVVSNVEPNSLAWAAGLRAGSRLVEICQDATATLTHDQMLNLLRNASTVKLVYLPPHEDGTARRGVLDDIRPNHAALCSPQFRFDDNSQMSASYSGSWPSGMSRHQASSSKYDTQRHSISRTGYDTSPHSSHDTHPAPVSHAKQASHDSAGSRSSGGYGSDRQGSRHDLRSHDNTPKEEARKQSDGNTQHWKVYPAYNPEYVNVQAISTRNSDASFWLDHNPPAPEPSDHHGDSGYHSNNSSASRTPKNAYSSQKISSFSYNSFKDDGASGGSSSLERAYANRQVEPGSGLLGPPSMTNLSQNSDLSSHSTESHNKPRTRDDSNKDQVTLSSSGRQRQQAFHRRSYLESSPHGSAHSSPRNSRHLAGLASEENLARLRPGARGTKPSPPVNPNTFQEDLMRLIDPDLSFTSSDHSPDKHDARAGRPQRTHSDESLCGPASRSARHDHINTLGDVIFTTAKPAQTVNDLPNSKEHKLSPRATVDVPGSRSRHDSPTERADAKPKLILPESGSGLDWNNLVSAANAFETNDLDKKSVSMGKIHTEGTPASTSRLRNSKSTEIRSVHSSSPSNPSQGARAEGSRSADRSLTPASRSHSSGAWRSSPGSTSQGATTTDSAQRIQELEARVAELEDALERERDGRNMREVEMRALREENGRLLEESQTAAAQLRKFTEWFFNNIDRQ